MKETIPFAAMWMNLKIPDGSQVSQEREDKHLSIYGHTHPALTNLWVNEPPGQPTQDLIPSEIPRLWGAEHPENRGRGYIPPS